MAYNPNNNYGYSILIFFDLFKGFDIKTMLLLLETKFLVLKKRVGYACTYMALSSKVARNIAEQNCVTVLL